MAVNDWNQATLNKLKTLVEKGLSTSEIGKKLGMTKNSIVGKLNRLGWNAKSIAVKSVKKEIVKSADTKKLAKKIAKASVAKPISLPKKVVVKKTTKKPEKSVKAAAKEPVKKIAQEPVKSASKSKKDQAIHQNIIQHSLAIANMRPDQCRWPIGNPDSKDFHFCGEKVFAGKPYCYEHCLQAYQFQPKKTPGTK